MPLKDKVFQANLAAALLLAVVTTAARGQVPGGGMSFGGAARGMAIIKGRVVCTGCNLEEVQQAQPGERKLYQLSSNRGQVVMRVTTVNESAMFDTLAASARLWVRGKSSLLQRLGAEENLFKEMQIVGILRSTRTLDIFDVVVSG